MPSLLRKILFIAGAAVGVAIHQASATLTIDLRVVAVDGIPSPNPKVLCPSPGQIVTFDVYAIVTAATEAPGMEGFQIAVGSIVSANGGALGDVLTNELAAPFGASGSTVGRRIDLDGDGDLDIGSNATAASNIDSISARSSAMTTGNADGLGASEFKFYTFTVRLLSGDVFSINWRKTDFTGLTTEYIWQENGVFTNSRGVNGGSVALVQLGAPILNVLTCVPEPSAFGMVLLGAVGIAGLRRIAR